MNNKKIKKILIVVSVIIISLGIISGFSLSGELEQSIPDNKIYVDGTDFSGIVKIGGVIASKILGIMIVIGSICIDIIIWIIYLIIVLIVKLLKKIKNKKLNQL